MSFLKPGLSEISLEYGEYWTICATDLHVLPWEYHCVGSWVSVFWPAFVTSLPVHVQIIACLIPIRDSTKGLWCFSFAQSFSIKYNWSTLPKSVTLNFHLSREHWALLMFCLPSPEKPKARNESAVGLTLCISFYQQAHFCTVCGINCENSCFIWCVQDYNYLLRRLSSSWLKAKNFLLTNLKTNKKNLDAKSRTYLSLKNKKQSRHSCLAFLSFPFPIYYALFLSFIKT